MLNRDDERIAALAARRPPTVSYYGVAAELRELFPNDEELYGGPVARVGPAGRRRAAARCPAPTGPR